MGSTSKLLIPQLVRDIEQLNSIAIQEMAKYVLGNSHRQAYTCALETPPKFGRCRSGGTGEAVR